MNNKIYVGKRQQPVFDVSYWGSGIYIANAIAKYGKDNFSREVLQWCDTQEELNDAERHWISKLESRNPEVGYNIADGGNGCSLHGTANGFYGKHHTEEHKKRMSVRMSGTNNPASNPEVAKKISMSLMGHQVTQETRELWSKQRKGKTPWNKGKKGIYSEATLDKMRIQKKGGTLTDEHKNKIGNAIKSKNWHWYNNGVQNIKCNEKDVPAGFTRGRIGVTKQCK